MRTKYKVPIVSFFHSVASHKAASPDSSTFRVNLISIPWAPCPRLDRPPACPRAGCTQPLLQSPDLGLPHPSHRDLVTALLTPCVSAAAMLGFLLVLHGLLP